MKLLLLIIISFSTIYSQIGLNEFEKEFNLIKNKSADKHSYIMETLVKTYDLSGEIINREKFILTIDVIPLSTNEINYACKNFEIILNDSTISIVNNIKNYSYIFKISDPNPNEKGELFGISHAAFENLKDEKGNPIDQVKSYFVYNSFIDFHSLIDVFAADMKEASGIEDLKNIGDFIVHSAAFSEAPVNMGTGIKEGSSFKNGKISLKFVGLSSINKNQCAIIHYDSGESAFNMIMEPMPNLSITSTGSSHYFGDIFINLNSKWIESADLKEFVVSEVNMPSLNSKINNVFERELTLELLK